jgi:hypothetical protein
MYLYFMLHTWLDTAFILQILLSCVTNRSRYWGLQAVLIENDNLLLPDTYTPIITVIAVLGSGVQVVLNVSVSVTRSVPQYVLQFHPFLP